MTTTLDVRGLSTHFFSRAGVVRAVDDVSFTVETRPGHGAGGGKRVGQVRHRLLAARAGRPAGPRRRRARSCSKAATSPGWRDEEMRRLRGRHIAMVFQDPMMTLNPVLRIDTQMIEAVQAHERVSRAEARARARDALGMVGIPSPEERLRAYPHQFSGGMRQRVAIAIALLHRPALVIADEPTTALDVTIQAQILAQMQELCAQLRHRADLDHARPYGDRRPRRPCRGDVRGAHRRERHAWSRCWTGRCTPIPPG